MQGVPPLACFNSRAFLKSLTFAWTALSGFQSTGSIFLFCAPNFCLDRPFGFSVHRDALYCLSCLFSILLKAEVLFIVLSPVSLSECNRSRGEC
ncbi:transmembrane protein, putative [Medicago truncatula]|uniref:Transmembrane protein, putative n=1 Tax=Medicago truncatula TaxID=3880 RepID=G7J9G4_MEDTR|nr:transmembrane protein, putative [Medicago truncatula]